MVEINRFQSPIGLLLILALKEGVVKISFSNKSQKELKNWCQDYLGLEAKEGTNFTSEAKSQILNYLNARRKLLNFPILHINSPFRKKVLETERKIPYGQTRSYVEVAQMVNSPRASRAVGSANAANPLPLYFPCHRIICSDGSLGRFGWGLEVKKWLLEMETNWH